MVINAHFSVVHPIYRSTEDSIVMHNKFCLIISGFNTHLEVFLWLPWLCLQKIWIFRHIPIEAFSSRKLFPFSQFFSNSHLIFLHSYMLLIVKLRMISHGSAMLRFLNDTNIYSQIVSPALNIAKFVQQINVKWKLRLETL